VRTHSKTEHILEAIDRIYRKIQGSQPRQPETSREWQTPALSDRLGSVTLTELVEEYLAGDGSTIRARRVRHLRERGLGSREALWCSAAARWQSHGA